MPYCLCDVRTREDWPGNRRLTGCRRPVVKTELTPFGPRLGLGRSVTVEFRAKLDDTTTGAGWTRIQMHCISISVRHA